MAKKKRAARRKKQAAASVGLSPAEMRTDTGAADALAPTVERDGGVVLGTYRDPFGGKPILIVSLPIDRVEPTPYQRDASDTHVKRLMTVIETLDRFLDPLIVIRRDDSYWTPNGNHRLQAMRRLGAKLKGRGFTSPYLRSFVISRINPIRFSKATSFDFDEVLEKMSASVGKFNIDRVKPEEVTRASGPASDDD